MIIDTSYLLEISRTSCHRIGDDLYEVIMEQESEAQADLYRVLLPETMFT